MLGGGFGGESSSFGDGGETEDGEAIRPLHDVDPNRPAPVTYVPPEPSEAEEEIFKTIAQGINFDQYDSIPAEITGPGEMPSAIRSFSEAGLAEGILENVKKAKYTKPTPVQKYAIPTVLSKRDLMACAQTGSGKTVSKLF